MTLGLALCACDLTLHTTLQTFEDMEFVGCSQGETIAVGNEQFVCEVDVDHRYQGTVELYYDGDLDRCYLSFGEEVRVPVDPVKRSCSDWYLANAAD